MYFGARYYFNCYKNIKLNHQSLYRLFVVSMLLVDFEFSR